MYQYHPLSCTSSAFHGAVANAISEFSGALLIRRVTEGALTLDNYHSILLTIFPQSYDGPYNMALAAARCSWRHAAAKEYLVAHAAEESSHWRWIIDDLASTGYRGKDPRELFPHPSCEAYISFTERISEKAPYTRLATASVLEGIAAEFGEKYGRLLLQQLALSRDQVTFFLRHAETDKTHTVQIANAIVGCEFDEREWGWMTHVARVAGQFYRQMYDHDAFN